MPEVIRSIVFHAALEQHLRGKAARGKITPGKVAGLAMGMLGLVTILGWDIFL